VKVDNGEGGRNGGRDQAGGYAGPIRSSSSLDVESLAAWQPNRAYSVDSALGSSDACTVYQGTFSERESPVCRNTMPTLIAACMRRDDHP
jgi:hypothetical protein